MAKVGDVVTITFTGSHSLNASPVVSVLGNAADQVSQGVMIPNGLHLHSSRGR